MRRLGLALGIVALVILGINLLMLFVSLITFTHVANWKLGFIACLSLFFWALTSFGFTTRWFSFRPFYVAPGRTFWKWFSISMLCLVGAFAIFGNAYIKSQIRAHRVAMHNGSNQQDAETDASLLYEALIGTAIYDSRWAWNFFVPWDEEMHHVRNTDQELLLVDLGEKLVYRNQTYIKCAILEHGIDNGADGWFLISKIEPKIKPRPGVIIQPPPQPAVVPVAPPKPTQAVFTTSLYEQGTSGPNTWTLKYRLPEGLREGDKFIICPFGVEFTPQKKKPQATVFIAGENITTVRGTRPNFPKMPLVFTGKMREYPFVEIVASGWPVILKGELKITKVN